jgi:hypothetical protein
VILAAGSASAREWTEPQGDPRGPCSSVLPRRYWTHSLGHATTYRGN